MKKLLKAILPPLVGFSIYFLAVRYSSLYFTLRIDEMGLGNLVSFMAFFRYLLPLLFTVAVLTQIVVVVPVWNNVLYQGNVNKIMVFTELVFTCLLFSAGISYAICDLNNNIAHFYKLLIFLTMVQLCYWAINILILRLLK